MKVSIVMDGLEPVIPLVWKAGYVVPEAGDCFWTGELLSADTQRMLAAIPACQIWEIAGTGITLLDVVKGYVMRVTERDFFFDTVTKEQYCTLTVSHALMPPEKTDV